jgi:predicted nucleic acid-binding Zn ribbon protein
MAFVPLKDSLAKILRKHNIKDLDETKIYSSWPRIVGEKMASHATPVRITQKVLYVEVDDPLWLSQLKYMKIDIMEKIDTTVKEGFVKDIRFFLRNASHVDK